MWEPPPVLPQMRQGELGCEVEFGCRIWGRGMSGWDENELFIDGILSGKEIAPVDSKSDGAK